MNVQPDWEIDAFTKAQIRTGKRHSIVTDLILKLLGLDVSLALSNSCSNLHDQQQALAHDTVVGYCTGQACLTS